MQLITSPAPGSLRLYISAESDCRFCSRARTPAKFASLALSKDEILAIVSSLRRFRPIRNE